MTSKRINGTESIKTINSLFVVSLKSINLLQNTFAIGLRVRKAFNCMDYTTDIFHIVS